MKVKRVTSDDLESSYCCMSETPPGASWPQALPESKKWFKNNLGKHVEGYHLLDGDKVIGHIYWETSEKAFIPYKIEPKVAYIYCTEMLHDHMHKGYGKTMFDHMKDDLKKQGYKGITVDATNIKEYMHYEYFTKQGFRVIKEHDPFKLMYFPLLKQNVEAEPLKLSYKPSKDKVEVTLFNNFFCPVGAHMYQLFKKAAKGFSDKVKIVEIKATPETMQKYGTTEPLINGKIKIFGPASEKDVEKAIQEEINQFRK
jgi:predicted GNAT family acetyltransferase